MKTLGLLKEYRGGIGTSEGAKGRKSHRREVNVKNGNEDHDNFVPWC